MNRCSCRGQKFQPVRGHWKGHPGRIEATVHRLADSRGNPDILRKIPSHGSLEGNQKKHRIRKSTRQNKGKKKKKKPRGRIGSVNGILKD